MYNNNEQPLTKYVVLERTIRELYETAKSTNDYSTELYHKEIRKHDDLSEEQKKMNAGNKWETNFSSAIRYPESKIYEAVSETAYKELKNGVREKLEEKIMESMMDSKLRVYIAVPETNDINRAYMDDEYGEEREKDTYINDENAMVEMVKSIKKKGWHPDETVLIEHITINIYNYAFDDITTKIKKLVKKFIRENMTYCIKQDKVIVPEEYIEKGKEGINEWRELKASKNKNNNMEKRMLRGMIRDKKVSVLQQMQRLVWRFPKGQNDNGTYDYGIPFLYIYGNGNTAMCKKLAHQVLGEKTDTELLNMTEEEIDKAFKDYWKEVLTRAIKQIDDVETYERK